MRDFPLNTSTIAILKYLKEENDYINYSPNASEIVFKYSFVHCSSYDAKKKILNEVESMFKKNYLIERLDGSHRKLVLSSIYTDFLNSIDFSNILPTAKKNKHSDAVLKKIYLFDYSRILGFSSKNNIKIRDIQNEFGYNLNIREIMKNSLIPKKYIEFIKYSSETYSYETVNLSNIYRSDYKIKGSSGKNYDNFCIKMTSLGLDYLYENKIVMKFDSIYNASNMSDEINLNVSKVVEIYKKYNVTILEIRTASNDDSNSKIEFIIDNKTDSYKRDFLNERYELLKNIDCFSITNV